MKTNLLTKEDGEVKIRIEHVQETLDPGKPECRPTVEIRAKCQMKRVLIEDTTRQDNGNNAIRAIQFEEGYGLIVVLSKKSDLQNVEIGGAT